MGIYLRSRKFLLPLLLSLNGLTAFAGTEISPIIERKSPLKNAVQLQITPRGLKLFDSRLSEILGNLGVNLDEGYFPKWDHTFNTIVPEDYRESNPESVKIYYHVRELLMNFVTGFSLNDHHQPKIEIGESGYVAEFSRFGIVTDEQLMKALGKRDGAILAIELEVKKMTIATGAVRVWDLNNSTLLDFGLEDLSINSDGSGEADVPLKIRLPFYVRMNGEVLEFDALTVESNIDQIPLALKYKKLIVPTFDITVTNPRTNDKITMHLNNEELSRYLESNMPVILQKVREGLGDFASKRLPEMLNKKAKEFLGGSLEQVQNIIPPGKEDDDIRPNFIWGLKLQNINLNKSLQVDLTAYVEDPINPKSTPLAANAARSSTLYGLLPTSDYDIALSVDRSLINRVLQLSYERKNFEKIKQKDGSILKLRAAPAIDYVKTPKGAVEQPNETFIKMRVSAENQPESIFLKETIVIDFDIIAKLQQKSDKSGLQIILHSIDPESMRLDDSYISFAGKLVKSRVREGVKDKLREISAKWKKSEESIPGSFPLPPKILGLESNINRLVMDEQGHLVMYLNYPNTGAN